MARKAYHRRQIERLEGLLKWLYECSDEELKQVPEKLAGFGYVVHFLDDILAPHSPDVYVIAAHDCMVIPDRARTTMAQVWCSNQAPLGTLRRYWHILLFRLMREHRRNARFHEPYLRSRVTNCPAQRAESHWSPTP